MEDSSTLHVDNVHSNLQVMIQRCDLENSPRDLPVKPSYADIIKMPSIGVDLKEKEVISEKEFSKLEGEKSLDFYIYNRAIRERTLIFKLDKIEIRKVMNALEQTIGKKGEVEYLNVKGKDVLVGIRHSPEWMLLLEKGNEYDGKIVKPIAAKTPSTVVQLRDVPLEIEDIDVKMVISQYGTVSNYRELTYREFPDVKSGHRRISVRMIKPVPNYVKIRGYNILCLYDGVVQECFKCKEKGHFLKNCSKISCFKCGEKGHIHMNCKSDVISDSDEQNIINPPPPVLEKEVTYLDSQNVVLTQNLGKPEKEKEISKDDSMLFDEKLDNSIDQEFKEVRNSKVLRSSRKRNKPDDKENKSISRSASRSKSESKVKKKREEDGENNTSINNE